MIYDEKIQKEHRGAVRSLMARGCDTVIEIQKEMHSVYGVEFDFHYIGKLMHKVRKDQKREMEKLATPEGKAEYLRKYQEREVLLQGILANLKK